MRLIDMAAAAALLGCAPAALAGVCDAPFMHDGGHVHVAGTGAVKLDARLDFSDVGKTSPDDCSASVRGSAAYQLLGLPGGEADIDHDMRVTGGKSTFARRGRAAEPGKSFDLRLLGLFGYPDGLRQGQRLPGQAVSVALGEPGKVQMPSVIVRIGEKTVGTRERIETARGRLQCWPIRYERSTDPAMISVGGVSLPLPAMRSTVTDWYCPDAGMVMKQEIIQSGQQALIEVKALR